MKAVSLIFAHVLMLVLAPAHAADYSVQIGAYKDPALANTKRAASIGKVSMRKGKGGLTHIDLGPYKSMNEAQAALQRAHNAGYMDAFISDGHGRPPGRQRVAHTIQRSSSQQAHRESTPSVSQRLFAAKAKVPIDQHSNIVIVDGRLMLKEGDSFRALE